MKNVKIGIFCCLAGLAVAAEAARLSSDLRQDANNLGYIRLVPRADSGPPSSKKPVSGQKSGSSPTRSPASSDPSSSRHKSPAGRDSFETKSSPQVIRRPFVVQKFDYAANMPPESSSIRKQTIQTGGGNVASSSSPRERNRGIQMKKPSVLSASSESKRQNHSQLKSSEPLAAIDDPVKLQDLAKSQHTAFAIANGPAHLQVGVLGNRPTTKLVSPGRTGILSVSHDSETVWATGSSAEGGSATAHATGYGVATSVVAGYKGRGYIRTFGSNDHETHTEVGPGKKEDQQWEVQDPHRTNMAASLGISGPGQVTAGGLSAKHTSYGKDRHSIPRS